MIRRQKYIMRDDLKNNPDWYYLFGDNSLRQGLGGQAKEMRGEPNAIGIATKIAPGNFSEAYFSDYHYYWNLDLMLNDAEKAVEVLREGGTLIIPADGLGTGLSAMDTQCPRTYKALQSIIEYLYNVDERWNS